MRMFLGLGPAPARRPTAPSHRGVLFACWAAGVCLGCNVGHQSPTEDPAFEDDSKDNDTNDNNTQDDDDDTSDTDANVALGDAAAGGTAAVCNDDAYRCVNVGQPERQRCKDGNWVEGEPCGNGLVCEIANGSSTTCVTPPEACDGGACADSCQVGTIDCRYVAGAPDVAVSCPSGSKVQNTCNEDTPHCVSEFGCKQCSRAEHCTQEPPACHEYTCNDDFECELVAQNEGQTCTTGVCSTSAQCVACNQPEDCGDPGLCHHFACNANACELEVDTERSYCESDAGNLCNLEGACVACVTTNDCPSTDVPECYRPVCTTDGACATEPQDANTTCNSESTHVCDGAGACVECLTLENCGNAQVCHEKECVDTEITVGWYQEEDDSVIATTGYLYLRRLEPLQYPATLESFGQIALETTSENLQFALYEDNGLGTGPEGDPLTTLALIEGLPAGARYRQAPNHPTLQPGAYHWLAFRVSDSIALKRASGTVLTYQTGFVVPNLFEENLPTTTGEALDGGSDAVPYAVSARLHFTE